ncbi:hypothetical protein [Nostoc sp. CMAA1605]|uniref:hypothetical protein n=1 Tax=Nostoc sp. CMAA1605 TaxID=2055159 RepID=UPI001F20E28D|nr:hypothetical protein [Nostoc sp. CMAA1605]MCF4968702.1 hypothetical protein [Nostoc sp. CMAA1605]
MLTPLIQSITRSLTLPFIRNYAREELRHLANTYQLHIDVTDREQVITTLSALCDLEEVEYLEPDQMNEYDFWRWVINSMPALPRQESKHNRW